MIGQISITKISKTTFYQFFTQNIKNNKIYSKNDRISIFIVDINILGR